jgi:hypothetical protein
LNFLAFLEASALSEWLSVSMLGFPMLIALHSVGMAVVVGLSLIVAMRLNGLLTDIDQRQIPRFLTIAIWGFGLNLVTGIAIFITRGPEYIVSAVFLLKMLLVITSAAILFWLRDRLIRAELTATALLNDRLARIMSLIGTGSWFSAVVAGRLIAYLSSLYR